MNESKISAILGALVVIVVGVMVVNYFRNLRPGTTTPTAVNTEQTNDATASAQLKHKVAKGDSLWSIAVKYYDNGFRWTEIKEANSLSDNEALNEGRELIIPNVAAAQASPASSPTAIAQATPATQVVATTQPTIRPTLTPAPIAQASPTPTTISQTPTTQTPDSAITGNSYTVVKGDNLWNIAEKAYGDGFQWTKIAEANKLVNPRVIHSGNVLTIPR